MLAVILQNEDVHKMVTYTVRYDNLSETSIITIKNIGVYSGVVWETLKTGVPSLSGWWLCFLIPGYWVHIGCIISSCYALAVVA